MCSLLPIFSGFEFAWPDFVLVAVVGNVMVFARNGRLC